MNRLKLLVILLLLGSAGLVRAELQVHVGKAVFGLPLSASPAAFVERLGVPTADLPLRQGRRGLLYGNALLLEFEMPELHAENPVHAKHKSSSKALGT